MGSFPLMAIGEANIAYSLRRIVGFRGRAGIFIPDFAGVYPHYCPVGFYPAAVCGVFIAVVLRVLFYLEL